MKKSDLKKFATAVRRRKKALKEYEELRGQADKLLLKAAKVKDDGYLAWQNTAFRKLGLKHMSYAPDGALSYTFEDGTILTEKEVLGNGE